MEKISLSLLTALRHVRDKTAALGACRRAAAAQDSAAAHALGLVLGETLRHAALLEGALRDAGIIPALLDTPHIPVNERAPLRKQLEDLAAQERVAVSCQIRQAEQLCPGAERELLLSVTREEAVHLRLFRSLTARL